MQLKVTWNGGAYKADAIPATESDLFKEVGKCLLEIGDNVPNYLDVETDHGKAYFNIGKRGTWESDDGITHPSMYVTCSTNTINGLAPSVYKEAYLTCIHRCSNNFKFYHLKPQNVGTSCVSVGATYGRIGSSRNDPFGVKDLQTPYDPYLYWIRYFEKLSKGYIDQSDIFLGEAAKPDDKQADAVKDDSQQDKVDPVSAELFILLKGFAKGYVEHTLASPQHITKKQLEEGWKEWNALCGSSTIDEFNQHLDQLLRLSPRKARYVNDLYANRKSDFASIIDREETLLNAMEAVVSGGQVQKQAPAGSFGDDFEIYEATDKQVEQVKRHLNGSLDTKIKKIYRVIPKEQKKIFNKYLSDNNIKKVKMFWHGSRNENWFSIMKNSLVLHPNAKMTGRMLGDGIYFAPSAMKSWGYTSYMGSYWAHGTSKTALMGLYAVAYGQPHEIHSYSGIRQYSQSEMNRLGKNCVHAFPDCGLRNDEVVFYDERAVLLNYLVVFGD